MPRFVTTYFWVFILAMAMVSKETTAISNQWRQRHTILPQSPRNLAELHVQQLSMEDKFSEVYKKAAWGTEGNGSGPGMSLS